MALQPGATLGPYEILGLIGAGGMGEVYRARDPRLDREVAVKVLPHDRVSDESRRQRFVKEAKAASALNHPHIVTIHEIESANGIDFLVMEYVRGKSLDAAIPRHGLRLGEVLRIAIPVADALAAAHARGIIHRDLKPANVMVGTDGAVKVLDFGLAKLIGREEAEEADLTLTADVALSAPGTIAGTAAYMPPEQATGEKVDARSDIFSFGAMLYEMVTGVRAFAGTSTADTLSAVVRAQPKPPTAMVPGVPTDLEKAILRCLRKDPARRFQHMADAKVALQEIKEDSESGSATAVSAPRKRRGWIAVAATVLVLGVVAGAWVWTTARLALRPVAPTAAAVERNLSRLTFAPGLQTDVTFSPDGRFIAYASDQGGNFDIWVQPAARSGDPVQVTKSAAADTEPDWSPDGGQIVFRSERDGGGLYVVSALGGPERRLAAFGVRPKWSPDGSRVLFASAPVRGGAGALFVVGTDGVPPQRVLERFAADVTWLYGWAWHPDGRRVSMVADTPREDMALYTVPLDGSSAIITSLPSLQRLGDDPVRDFSWAGSGAAIYFELSVKFVSNLWRLDIDAGTLKAGSLVQLTAGAGQDTRLAVSRDGSKIAFTTKAESIRIWSYRLHPVTGRVTGDADPVTDPTMTMPATAALAPDGRHLAYAIAGVGTGRWELWTTDLMTGQKHLVSRDNHNRFAPKWSRDSSRLVYHWRRGVEGSTASAGLPDSSVAIRQVSAGDETLLSTPTQQNVQPNDWSPDGNAILVSWTRPGQSTVLTLWPVAAAPHADTHAMLVAGEPKHDLWQARFSPNGRWISFLAITASTGVVCVVPSRARTARATDWTCVTDPRIWMDKPRWSADGKLLYVWRRHGSFFNVWALRFDDARGTVAGAPLQITHLDSPAHRIWGDDLSIAEPSVAGTSMTLPVAQATGSIWMLDNVDR